MKIIYNITLLEPTRISIVSSIDQIRSITADILNLASQDSF